MKYAAMTVAAIVAGLASGCRSTPDPAQQQLLAQLREINASLQVIAMNTPDGRIAALSRVAPNEPRDSVRSVELEAVEKIQALPENPTDEDIRCYVADIRSASLGSKGFSAGDPQVEMLKKIGPGHLDVLIPFLDEHFYYLDYAINDLVGEDDMETVLALLPRHPSLAQAVGKKNWSEEAKETIFQLARYSHNTYLLEEVLSTYVNTPEDRQRLLDLYALRPELHFLFNTIKSFPDVDLGDVTTRAWELLSRNGNNTWALIPTAARAAAYGNKEALGQAIFLLNMKGNSSPEALQLLVECTRQAPSLVMMQKWYNENADKLVFDKAKGVWEVK